MTNWPKDNQSARNAFYGDPGKGEIPAQLVPVVPPFKMYYTDENGTKLIKSIMFHKRAAPALLAALNEIWDYCQHDQHKIDAAGVSKYAGAYNHRMVRGSSTKWSNHAYGTAIDLNAEENGLYAKGNMPQFVVDAFCRQGWMWGGWYTGRKDPMHFEAVDNGGRQPKSAPPIIAPVPHLFDEADDSSNNEPAAVETEDVATNTDDTNSSGDDAPANVQPVHAQYSLENEVLQKKLTELRYHEVGLIDGLWGGKLRGAITAFLNDRGKSPDGLTTDAGFTSVAAAKTVNDEVSKAIAERWTRPMSPARAEATAKDIAPKVATVQQNLWQRLTAKVAAGLAALGFSGSSLSSAFEGVKEKTAPLREFFSHVPPEVWFLAMGGVALLVWWLSTRAVNAAVDDYKAGKIN